MPDIVRDQVSGQKLQGCKSWAFFHLGGEIESLTRMQVES
jgi:hypothetical protein